MRTCGNDRHAWKAIQGKAPEKEQKIKSETSLTIPEIACVESDKGFLQGCWRTKSPELGRR